MGGLKEFLLGSHEGARRRKRDMVADVVQAALQALTATVSGDSKEDGKPGQNDLYNSAQVLNTESRLDFMLHLRAVRNRVERLIDGAEIPALAAALKPEYGILAHNSCARREGADWTVPIEGWMFRRNEGRHKTRLAFCRKVLIEMAIGLDTEAFDEAAKRRFEDRGRLIFRTICFRGGEFGRQLEVRFGGPDGGDRWRPLPEKTDFHGRVECELRLTQEEAERFTSGDGGVLLEMRCASKLSVPQTTTSQVHLVEEEGLSIISDVDDTVKVTEVFLGKGSVVRKTFYDEFEAVSGMAELFQDWSRTSPGMSFHFVSNSPQELYEPLRDLLQDSGFPSAALHLRVLGSRGKERKDFKKRTILQLLGQFPKRRFILVGDSGEGDARIYADVYRQCPNQVAKILIRQVSANNPLEPAVFAGIDDSLWQVFREPSEVGPQDVEGALERLSVAWQRLQAVEDEGETTAERKRGLLRALRVEALDILACYSGDARLRQAAHHLAGAVESCLSTGRAAAMLAEVRRAHRQLRQLRQDVLARKAARQ